MSRSIKGLNVEIQGSTTGLDKALKDVNGTIKTTQSQLKDVEKLLKLDPGNTELLAQKHRLLGEAVSETKEKLETLKAAAEQASTALANGDISQEQYDALQTYLDTDNITPVFDFGYGMGERMYGDGEYTYETRGVMNNLTTALLEGNEAVDSWASLRDAWTGVISDDVDRFNGYIE